MNSDYAIVFIRYKNYCSFYECNNRNITYDIFKKYAKIKEDMVSDEYKQFTRLNNLPSTFPNVFNHTFYNKIITKSAMLLLNSKTERTYKEYYIDLLYRNELWCFEKDGYVKPLFICQSQERDLYEKKINEFLTTGFPITELDIYKHPFKEIKNDKLPNSYYFTKGTYVRIQLFDYLVDLLETPSLIFKEREVNYDDDINATVDYSKYVTYDLSNKSLEENTTTQVIEPAIEESKVSEDVIPILEKKESIKDLDIVTSTPNLLTIESYTPKQSNTYVESKIPRPIQIIKTREARSTSVKL